MSKNKTSVFEFYENYSEDSRTRNVSAFCKECKKEIKGQVSVTSNFIKHLKVGSNIVKASMLLDKNCLETSKGI